MSDDREKLKALLLSEEMAQIEALKSLLNDHERLSEKISEVLDSAADLTIAKNPAFQKKFSKIDSKYFIKAIKANKDKFIDTLTPIMGPIIRRSVTSAIRRLSSDINRAIELGFSAKALKWRWLALKTGVPFTEIVFNNTVEYQVQQVFLIDNNTGLLIQHAGHEESLLQDKDAMSAMLTAIQDFVKDSVSNDGEGLTAAELGDSLVWLVSGSQANMAVVIKGAPTQRLHNKIIQASENIHIEFHQEIEDQNQWNNNPELKVELEQLLLTKTQSDKEKGKGSNNGTKILVLLLLCFITWLIWSSYHENQLHKRITEQLNQTPGFILSELHHSQEGFVAVGLADPLTDYTQLDKSITIQSTPFISLDDEIIKKRVTKIFDDPNIKINVEKQHITIEGVTKKTDELLRKITIISALSGINQFTDNTTQLPAAETLQSFVDKNPPPDNLKIQKVNDVIVVTGTTTAHNLNNYINQIKKFGQIDDSPVEIISISTLTQMIDDNTVNVINPRTLNSEQIDRLDEISSAFIKLLTLKHNARINITAENDCQGSVIQSNKNSQSRLNLILNHLIDSGLNKDHIITNLKKCIIDTGKKDFAKIVVRFEVIQ